MPVWLNGLFASPWMLLWLPAVVAPLVVHLLYRQRYREISWAAMEYLLAAIEKSKRRMQIQQWLLLVVRMLLLLFIVLAMAEPLVRNLSPLPLSNGGTHHIFLLDKSYSMGYRAENVTDFQRAKKQIVDRIGAGQSGDGYSLILMGEQAEIIVGQPSLDLPQFLAELDALPTGQAGADLDAALEAAQNLIDAAGEEGDFSRHAVTIVSDLGRTTWAADLRSDRTSSQRATRLARLAKGGSIEVVSLGSRTRNNVAVVDLVAADQVATVAEPTQFIATLHSFATQSLQGQAVELWVDDVRVDQKNVDLIADTDTQVAFTYPFIDPGPHAVRVRTVADQLPIDDERFLAVHVKEKINILLVRGKRGATLPLLAAIDGGDETFHAAKVEVVDESRVAELDLNRYDCIFLCNVAQWTSQEAVRLKEYVEQGGGLVTMLGDQVLADRYNRQLFDGADRQQGPDSGKHQSGFLPAKVGELFYDANYHFPDPKDYAHRMLAPWKGNPRTGLTSVPVLEYFRLEIPEDSSSKTILWLDTGDPLLVLSRIGSGWSLLLATDPTDSSRVANDSERSWSLIASWLNAQPFFEGLWKAVIGGRRNQSNIEVGQSLQGKLTTSISPQSVVLELPDSLPRTVKIAVGPGASWSFGGTETSGIYRLQAAEDAAADSQTRVVAEPNATEKRVYAVNLNTHESNLKSLSLAELSPEWRRYASEQTIATVGSSQDLAEQRLGTIFLWLVLLLLFLEIFLAWWIGNRFA